MTPEELEHYVLVASDASNLANQQQANSLLNQWLSSTDDRIKAELLLVALRSSQKEVVLFFVLTAYLQLRESTVEQRAQFRQELFRRLLSSIETSCWSPSYLRTKVGVLLARLIQLDFVNGNWSTAFDDLQNPNLLQGAPDIFLRTLVALMDDFGHNETSVNASIKDRLRGFPDLADPSRPTSQPPVSVIPPSQTMSAKLLQTTISLLAPSLEMAANSQEQTGSLQISVLALTALKGILAWIDLSLVLEDQQQTVLQLVFRALALGSSTESPMDDAAVVAIQCLVEMMARGMEEEKKIAILVHTKVLETIYAHVDLKTVDASPIDVVLEVAKFIDRTGLECLSVLTTDPSTLPTEHPNVVIRSQLLELFFRCFAYDDIDVSGAVIPLAGSLIPPKAPKGAPALTLANPLLSQLLAVTYRQMRYPADFQYDYEDEDEAEEELYRAELRKLNEKLVRVAPEACLESMGQTLAQLKLPLSAAPTPDLEAALRLVFHYCEGIRPSPGLKVVMRNETFCSILVAIHKSDVCLHPHREVLIRYYETAVRYYPLLKERADLLQIVLESISGPRGLQHEHPRVRSRACYMLLRLVKSVGSSNGTGDNVLRPYVETAVAGIEALLGNTSIQLRSDDTLNLFETIGLLLGKTGLEPAEQQRYLTEVMTPHVRSIEQLLEQRQLVLQDPDTCGEILANSIAAIAFLTKGFKKPAELVQMVLFETLKIATTVLELLPSVPVVRHKILVLIQRLIQCLEGKVLPVMPQLLYLLISNSTTEDILDVAQVFNQLCIKFRSEAIPALDGALLPFLHQCHALAHSGSTSTGAPSPAFGSGTAEMVAPHERTERLSIQKFNYMVLQHIVINKVSPLLLTPTNLSSLEQILQSLTEGAFYVEDLSMKKTCLLIVKELFEQWVQPENGKGLVNGKSGVNGSTESAKDANGMGIVPSPAVVQGLVQFVCQVWIPGALQGFASHSNFSVNDMNSWRCVLELAALLDLLRERLPDIYQQEFVQGILSRKFGCPPEMVGQFASAVDRKAVEASLKVLLAKKATGK